MPIFLIIAASLVSYADRDAERDTGVPAELSNRAGSASDGGAFASGERGPMRGMTAAHNAARAATGRRLKPLIWDDGLAESARAWAESLAENGCTSAHSNADYGENLFIQGTTAAPGPSVTARQVVWSWTSEKACYTYGTVGGSEVCSADCQTCGHYTQVVWAETRRVGCGVAACSDGDLTYQIWVCHYDPPGNTLGHRPY